MVAEEGLEPPTRGL